MRFPSLAALIALALPAPALANSGTVSVEIPKQAVRNYRKPYVAVWIEDSSGKMVKNVVVLHDQARLANRWLPDLSTWWREGGRSMDMPADGISSPTRAPGRYKFGLSGLNRLSPGKYSLVVEGSREHGGRELVKVPFRIQRGRASSGSAKGSREVGRVSVSIRP
ncbi:DUF2271 domain-containing protein [Alteriqipengyuania sp.]|uniref:DUF2271 domain-containing protein n=1 Tax=Alteriqipengyuania sp. TaxID=2800692 RepID=UPI00351627F1